jgi:16S rRNA (guanine527-N7)-methyltransferase
MGVTEPSADPADAIADLVADSQALGLVLGDQTLLQFESYLRTLLLWRRRLSLISTADPRRIVSNHVIDSLHVVPFVKPGFRVVDLGSGAGFPGIPLAIVCPGAKVELVESRRKKASFLREAVRNARLDNVDVIEARAEALGSSTLGACEVVVSRALWRISTFLEMSHNLLKTGGVAIAMKGPKGLVEEAACRRDGFSAPQIVAYRLGGGESRALVIYRKGGEMPNVSRETLPTVGTVC